MFDIISNNKPIDTSRIPEDILTYSEEQYGMDLKLLGKENICLKNIL
ncbi:MAG: hypothetical protein RLZZ81_819 [Pseudomonadota bacterium]|jgi:hypothetical protein